MTSWKTVLAAKPDSARPLAERYFFQVLTLGNPAARVLFELTAAQHELMAGFVPSRVDPTTPAFDPSTDPRSASYDGPRVNAADALLESFFGRPSDLELSRAELEQAKGVVTFTLD